jgi:hypothetical protein
LATPPGIEPEQAAAALWTETKKNVDSAWERLRAKAIQVYSSALGIDKNLPVTFEQIDQGIRETELFNLVRPGERHVMEAAEPEGKLREISRAYQMVRPILIAMGDSPFIRTAWRHALQIYIQLMDSIFLDGRSQAVPE